MWGQPPSAVQPGKARQFAEAAPPILASRAIMFSKEDVGRSAMPTRNINLTPELDRFVATKIKSGRYEDASEVIRAAPFETLRDWECFDADTGKDSAREIREYFIPDFSNWKDHDSYQEAFDRLIGDLKASDSRTK